MKTLFLLIVLTRNGAGDINISFVNTPSENDCLQKAVMMEQLFAGADIPVVERRCIESDQFFSAFMHNASSGDQRYFYRIVFNDEKANIKTMPDWKSCNNSVKNSPEVGRAYCGSSVQRMIE